MTTIADPAPDPSGPPPRWDLEVIYPALDDRAFQSDFEGALSALERLAHLYDANDVRAVPGRPVTAADVETLETILSETNELLERVETLASYLYARVTTDSRDDAAGARYNELRVGLAPLGPLSKRLAAWLAALGVEHFTAAGPHAAEHAFVLHDMARLADRQMGEGEESLAAELRSTGSSAWARLHGDLSSQLTVTLTGPDGGSETISMSQARGLATDPDAAVRERAYRAELEAWSANAVAFAAAINGVKGERIVLNRRRGWADDLEPVLTDNRVSRASLDAMTEAVEGSLPDFQRYLRTKARLLGHDSALPWWDLFAPLPGAAAVSWPEATSMIEHAFAGYSGSLEALATRAWRERWVDAQMRAAKRGGAYCASVGGGASRIMMNFDHSLDAVSTLAHELGHAYHNVTLAVRTPLQRDLPMALAETASIFCETLLFEAALDGVEDVPTRLGLLDTNLLGAAQVVVDIHSRFRFEQELFRRRRRTTLSVDELCGIMTDAQEAAFGDALDRQARHPFMWAVKPHYYDSDFYNWPYTFGLLFGLGLHAVYRAEPEQFRSGYDDLLSSVGMAPANELAARFGIDIESRAFWESSLDRLRTYIDEYGRLAAPPS